MMGQLLNQRYQFIRTLGDNQLLQTYLVGDTQLPGYPQCVAKQFKLPTSNPRTLKFSRMLLQKNAEALKSLGDRTQIPRILDYFADNQSFFLIEEFVSGSPLTKEIETGQPASAEQVKRWLQEVLEILDVVHDRGIIHRCLKPSNLIRRDSDGSLMLIGFGVFKEVRARFAKSSDRHDRAATNGSSTYVSPEQALGQAQFNSDIYALGIIGIQALTGRSLAELSALRGSDGQAHWYDGIQVSPTAIGILDRMVQVDSTQRYQSAIEVLADLVQWEIEADMKEDKEIETGQDSSPMPIASRTAVPKSDPELMDRSRERVKAPPRSGSRTGRLRLLLVGGTIAIAAISAIAALFAQLPQKSIGHYWVRRGTNAEQQADRQQAIGYYTRAINSKPDSGRAYYRRGLAYQHLGNREAALEDLTRAIQLGYRVGESYYQRGNIRLLLGDRQGAQADYTEAIKRQPELAAAYVNRGSTRADAGDDKGAVEDYTQAIRVEPTLAAAYLNRCLSWSNIGDQNRAIADCTKAIDLRPTHTFAYQNRGLVRRRQGDIDGAIEDYNIAINLDPDDADPYYNRGLARRDLGDNRGAIADFTRAIERNSNHALAYYDRGLTYRELGNREEAIADFQQSAQLCLDVGRQGCYEDAQYQLNQLDRS